VRFRPVSPDALVTELADAIDRRGEPYREPHRERRRLNVAIDGPDAAAPHDLALSLIDPLKLRGRAAIAVSAHDFLRPASVRLELGRASPEAYYARWFDLAAIAREVLNGSGRVLPTLWDADTDRATRAGYVHLPPGAVVILSGPLLLGAGLALDYTVHLHMTSAALARRTPESEQWTLPAHERYATEVDPASFADAVIRADDPRHPAVSES
jgi:hypothetical protein